MGALSLFFFIHVCVPIQTGIYNFALFDFKSWIFPFLNIYFCREKKSNISTKDRPVTEEKITRGYGLFFTLQGQAGYTLGFQAGKSGRFAQLQRVSRFFNHAVTFLCEIDGAYSC